MHRIVFLLFALYCANSSGQIADDIFFKARTLAINKQYPQARELARQVLNINENYNDARVLIARTYAWEQKYDSARIVINYLIGKDPSDLEAIHLLADIAYWTGQYAAGLEIVEKGLNYYHYNQDLLIKKAKFLLAMGQNEEAERALLLIAATSPSNKEAKKLLYSLRKYKNRIIAEHTFDFYNEPALHRWHVSSLQFQQNAAWGTYIAKLNAGQNVLDNEIYLSRPAFQLEADAYPIIPDGYIYTNIGLSDGDFFPTLRAGLEPFITVKKTWEYSFGLRYLNHTFNGATRHTSIITGSVSKYFSSNWISFRPYFVIKRNDLTISYYLFFRHYHGDPDNYIGGALGSGSSPDETFNKNPENAFLSLNTYRIRFDFQQKITKHLLFKSLAGYSLEKIVPSQYRNRYDVTIYMAYLF